MDIHYYFVVVRNFAEWRHMCLMYGGGESSNTIKTTSTAHLIRVIYLITPGHVTCCGMFNKSYRRRSALSLLMQRRDVVVKVLIKIDVVV